MRSEATNTWSEGMIKDLNPINTPNNALTDCLNGTIITYDGNEYSLQNDRGNYPLSNCKLSKNYVPIGLKEYGGILYIVSYNPIDDKVQIGSYPSTLQIMETNPDEENPSAMIRKAELNPDIKQTYEDVVKQNCDIKVIYGSNPDKYLINPGDNYRLEPEIIEDSTWKYQTIKYFILSEDRKLYDISELVFKGEVNNGFRKASWGVPGWLAMQLKIAEIDDCTVSLEKVSMPAYLEEGATASVEFRISVSTSDPLIYNIPSPELYIDWVIKADDRIIKSGWKQLQNPQNIYNGAYSYRCTTGTIDGIPVSSNSTITIEVTPRLCNTTYDTVTTTYNISNNNEVTTFSIGKDKWWYYTSREEKLLNIQFSVEGLENLALAEDLSLKYTLYKILQDGNIEVAHDIYGAEILDRVVESWVPGNIESEIVLKLKTDSTDINSYVEPENMYIVSFSLHSAKLGKVLKTDNKLVIASELFNKVSSNKYDTINFDTWFDKYSETVKNSVISVTNIGSPSIQEGAEAKLTYEGARNIWDNTIKNEKYTDFLKIEDYKAIQKEDGFKVISSIDYKVNTKYTTPLSLLYGPLWNNTLENLKVNFNCNAGAGVLGIDKTTGKVSTSKNTLENTISGKYSKTISYIPDFVTNYDLKVWSYKLDDNLDPSRTPHFVSATLKDVDTKNNKSTFYLTTNAGSTTVASSSYTLYSPPIVNLAENLKTNEFLLAKVSVSSGGIDTGSLKGAILSLGGSGKTILSCNTDDVRGTFFKYYLLVPASSDYKEMQYIYLADDESSAASIFDNLKQSIEHLKCNDDLYRGGFITMKKDIEEPTYPKTSIKISGNLNPNKLLYAGCDLLSQTGRNALQEKIKVFVGNDINLTNLDSLNYSNKFPVIMLGDKEESVSFNFDNTLLDEVLNKEDGIIEAKNLRILEQYKAFLLDPYLNGAYTETDDIFMLKDPSLTKYNSVINILNSKQPSKSDKLHFDTENWRGGLHPENAKTVNIGYYDPSIDIR